MNEDILRLKKYLNKELHKLLKALTAIYHKRGSKKKLSPKELKKYWSTIEKVKKIQSELQSLFDKLQESINAFDAVQVRSRLGTIQTKINKLKELTKSPLVKYSRFPSTSRIRKISRLSGKFGSFNAQRVGRGNVAGEIQNDFNKNRKQQNRMITYNNKPSNQSINNVLRVMRKYKSMFKKSDYDRLIAALIQIRLCIQKNQIELLNKIIDGFDYLPMGPDALDNPKLMIVLNRTLGSLKNRKRLLTEKKKPFTRRESRNINALLQIIATAIRESNRDRERDIDGIRGIR